MAGDEGGSPKPEEPLVVQPKFWPYVVLEQGGVSPEVPDGKLYYRDLQTQPTEVEAAWTVVMLDGDNSFYNRYWGRQGNIIELLGNAMLSNPGLYEAIGAFMRYQQNFLMRKAAAGS